MSQVVQSNFKQSNTALAAFVANNEIFLTAEQQQVYDQINTSVEAQQSRLFLDAPGSTGTHL